MVNIPRTTTVTTNEKSLFVTIGKHEFHNFLRVCPDVNYRMQQVMKDRMMSKVRDGTSTSNVDTSPYITSLLPTSPPFLTS